LGKLFADPAERIVGVGIIFRVIVVNELIKWGVRMFDQPPGLPLSPQWDDPLFTPGDRFPLGPPDWHWEGSDEDPSDSTVRPFSLRGVVAGPVPGPGLGPRYEYCEIRQIAVVHGDDGSVVPLSRHTKPGATEPQTSGYPSDGNPASPPPEEMSGTDYQSD
jgi:putative ATP-grasp target RiPP